jgi:hypothetical protein
MHFIEIAETRSFAENARRKATLNTPTQSQPTLSYDGAFRT